MADAGLYSTYVLLALVDRLKSKGLFDEADFNAAAQHLRNLKVVTPERSEDKTEALELAISMLEDMGG